MENKVAMKLKSILTGREYELRLRIGDNCLNLEGKNDWVADIILRKIDCSLKLGVAGYVDAQTLQAYNDRFNKK